MFVFFPASPQAQAIRTSNKKQKSAMYNGCADVKIPLHFFLVCSFELTDVAGNSIRHAEKDEEGVY